MKEQQLGYTNMSIEEKYLEGRINIVEDKINAITRYLDIYLSHETGFKAVKGAIGTISGERKKKWYQFWK